MYDLNLEKIARLEAEVGQLRQRIARAEPGGTGQHLAPAGIDALLDDLSVPVWVEDFSAVRAFFETLRAEGVEDFAAYFAANPEMVARCAGLVKIVFVNQESLRFFDVKERDDIPNYLPLFFDQESLPAFRDELSALAEGQLHFDKEVSILDLNRRRRHIWLNLSVAAGYEQSLGRVLISFTDISQRYQAEENLRAGEARLEAIYEAAGISMAVVSMDGQWVRWNRAFERTLGYTSAEMALRSSQDLTHPEDREVSTDRIRDLRDGKIDSYRVEKRFLHKNGSPVWMDLSVTPLRDRDGALVATLGAGVDITERKWAEAALRESESRLRAIIENSNDAIGVSKAGVHILANPAYLAMFGYSLEEVLILPVVDLIAPAEKAVIQGNIRRRAAGESASNSYETRGLHKDGSEFDMEVRVSNYQLQGEAYTLVILRDISARKQVEATLRQSARRLSNAEQVANIGSWEMDLETGKSYWSEQFYRICGYEPNSFDPTPEICDRLIYPADREQAAAVLARAIAEKSAYTIEKRMVRQDGEPIWVESHGVIECDPQGRPVRVTRTILDITERRKVEEALRRSEDLFRQLAENVREVLWVRDYHSRKMEYISPAYEDVWGRSCQSLYEQPESFAAAIHPEDQERFALAMRMQYEGQNFNNQSRIIRSDGTERWVWARSYPVFDQNGQPYRFVGIAEDITERKIQEQHIEADQRRLNSLLKISQQQFSSIQAMMDFVAEEVAEVCASPYGFVFYYDRAENCFKHQAASNQAMLGNIGLLPPKRVPDPRVDPSAAQSIWTQVVWEKKAILQNRFDAERGHGRATPAGHIGLRRFMLLPIFKEGDVYAVVGVANKPSDYTEGDRIQLDLMMQDVLKIIDRRLADEQLAASLEEKNALLKEIHHRVKNNMQVMISLLQMQAIQVPDERIRGMFYECKDRIYSMALVHEQLYGSTSFSQIRFGDYMERLVYDLYSAYNVTSLVHLDLTTQPVTLPIETAVPCGLIINELITNAFKHAFPGGRTGTVRAQLNEEDGMVLLRVCDDGVGIPAEVVPASAGTLGLKLIYLLSRQVGGELTLLRENGACFELRFKRERTA